MEAIMRKQTWLAAVILSCGVLMAGCGSGNRSYQKGIKAMQAGEYEDAGTFFKKAIKENDERAEYYIAYGMYLNEQGEYEEAVKQFERAYQDTENTIANVNNKQVYLGEAIAYTHLQKYEKALSLCKRALKLTNTASLDNRIWCSEELY
jgi:tetratricopeptide (TPR) repeat protein